MTNNYYTYGTDYFGNIVTGTYINTDNKYDILNDSGSIISQYYVFKINSSNSGITSGCYYQYSKSSSTWSSCIPMTGLKIYGANHIQNS